MPLKRNSDKEVYLIRGRGLAIMYYANFIFYEKMALQLCIMQKSCLAGDRYTEHTFYSRRHKHVGRLEGQGEPEKEKRRRQVYWRNQSWRTHFSKAKFMKVLPPGNTVQLPPLGTSLISVVLYRWARFGEEKSFQTPLGIFLVFFGYCLFFCRISVIRG